MCFFLLMIRGAPICTLDTTLCPYPTRFRCRPGRVAVLPTVETFADHLTEIAYGWPPRTIIVRGAREKYDAMAASQVAHAASGTVAFETAIAGVPTVVAIGYRR